MKFLPYIFAACALLFPSLALAASPAVNGSLYIGGSNVTTSMSFSVTVGAALTNSVLVCIVGGLHASIATGDVSAMSYGGVALTKRDFQASAVNTVFGNWVWTLDAPTAGTATLSETQTAMTSNAYCFVITGALQGGALDQAVGTGFAVGATTISKSITPTVNDNIIFDFMYTNGAPTSPVPGGSQTIWINDSPSTGVGNGAFGSYLAQATAGAQTMSMSWTGSNQGFYTVYDFKPAASVPVVTLKNIFLLILGIW